MFDQGPILVATTASPEDAARHVALRAYLLDRIEKHDRYRTLLRSWGDDELRSLAATAHRHLVDLVAASGDDLDDSVLYPGGTVGTQLHGSNVLDEPGPSETTTLRIGPFVDRLLAGEATVGDLAELFVEADERHVTDIDARSPRPLGTASRHVGIRLDPASRTMRAPLEAALRDIEQRWPTENRRAEAEALIAELRLDAWPFLAGDLVRRYFATLESIVRGKPWSLDYRMGDPRRGGTEPPDLQVPAFVPTGDPVVDSARLAKWQARLDEVRATLHEAMTTDEPKRARTRTARQDEQAGYRRDADWLLEHRAAGTSFRTIAQRDLGSADRWRDLQKTVNRAKGYLELADIPWPPAPAEGDAIGGR